MLRPNVTSSERSRCRSRRGPRAFRLIVGSARLPPGGLAKLEDRCFHAFSGLRLQLAGNGLSICRWDATRGERIVQGLPYKETITIVKLFDRVLNPREIRRRLGLNQEQFWTQIGVTQSGGSRYESGREMPKPVRELLRLVHVEQVDLSQVKRVDFEIISYLKNSHQDLYRSLRRAVRSQQRSGADVAPGVYDAPATAAVQAADDTEPILPGDATPKGTHPA